LLLNTGFKIAEIVEKKSKISRIGLERRELMMNGNEKIMANISAGNIEVNSSSLNSLQVQKRFMKSAATQQYYFLKASM